MTKLMSALCRPFTLVADVGRAISGIVVPPVCLGCQMPLQAQTSLCPSCWQSLQFISRPVCDQLGIPLPYDPGGITISAAALADPPKFDRARAAVLFDGTARKLIHGLKFNDQHGGLPLFTRWMQQAGSDLIETSDLVIPVPLSRRRLWSRRFNQSALLAKLLAQHCQKPILLDGLLRVRHTSSQIGLTDSQREKNVAGAFRVPKRYKTHLKTRNILLIDDVITTGATVNACARTLKRAGAAKVNVITIARVLPDHVREAIDLI